jgi:hypothetical protein
MVTLYQQLGINSETSFNNRAGRPLRIGSNGEVSSELLDCNGQTGPIVWRPQGETV